MTSLTKQPTRTLHLYLTLLCRMLLLITALAPATVTAQQAAQAASVKLTASSHYLITTELNHLTFRFEGLNNYPRVSRIEIDQADVFFRNSSAERVNGKIVYYLHYQFQPVAEGSYLVPPITFLTDRGKLTSDSSSIIVFSKQKLTKRIAEVEGMSFPYYTLMVSDKSALYPNETASVEYKVYLPNDFNIALWGLPQGNKTNCTAWRFTTPNRSRLHGRARINGKTYQVGHFRTNLTSLKPGKASIGPLTGRAVFHRNVMDRGMFRKRQFKFKFTSAKLSFTVNPLPANPPKSFQGDVGNYEMAAAIDAPKQITDNDSVQIIAQLKGKGNLATLSPPLLTNAKGWKVISQNRTDLGEARKHSQGIAEFTYLLQPDITETLATETPGLEFAFLQPELGFYQLLNIPGKTIKIEPTATTTANPEIQKNAQDYDSLITNPRGKAPSPAWYRSLPIWLIHLLPLSFILGLALRKIRKTLILRKMSNATFNKKKQALNQLEQTQDNFLRAAGSYIEQWVDLDKHPKANEILQLRDSLCFRPEADAKASQKRRQKILAILRQSSLLIIFLFAIQDSQATSSVSDLVKAANRDFAQQQYLSAITHFRAAPESENRPDLLYNIGLSYQLNDQPGMAALYYHKALKLAPTHQSASKNLAYVEEKNNSIIHTSLTDIERWIATLHPQTYLHLILFLTALLICLLLTLFTLKPRDGYLRAVLLCTICTPILLGVALFSYFSHPELKSYQHPRYLALSKAKLTTESLSTSKSITDITPASRVHLIAKRGRFSYIQLPNGTQGWVLSKKIASIE